MIRNFLAGIVLYLCLVSLNYGQTKPPAPFGPIPTENQMRWQEMEYYAFIHFSLNTYTNQPWGYGNEDINLFNPKKLDCRQWARIYKEAGMKGIIITAKHHCGFCLWPSKYTKYSVKNAPWKNGKGDVTAWHQSKDKKLPIDLVIDLGKEQNISGFRSPDFLETNDVILSFNDSMN
ncbi:MAG: alpha-L-fucosidase [Ignavibacteriaceae bacterium]